MMRRFVISALLLLLPTAPLAAQTVQLADGRVLLAAVEDATGEGLRVHRLDNGGYLDLRWEHLSPASATEWKRKFDLLGDSQDELLVRGDEVEFLFNGARQHQLGRIVERTTEHLVLQKKGQRVKVPTKDLLSVRKVDVPVGQLYTKDEFYQMHLEEIAPGDSADRWMLLGEDLIKVRDYSHAEEALLKAKELGNSRTPQQIETQLARLLRYKAAEKELNLIEDIQACRSRGQLTDFEKGARLLIQFDKDFPNSKLKGDFELEKKKFGEARGRYLTGQVAEKWRRTILTIAEKKVAEASSIDQIKEYCEGKMTDDIITRVAADLRIEANEVREFWGARAKTPLGKRAEHFGYGVGSWVLGKEAILKGTDRGKAESKQQKDDTQGENDPQMARYVKMLKDAYKRRQQAQQAGQQEEKMTPESWWVQAARDERIRWMKAYYAEFGGQLVVTYQTVAPCISCFGEGTTASLAPDGKMMRSECTLCQGTKWLRSFKAY